MSEEAKLVYLQEKINEARRNERAGFIFFVIGVICVFIGFDFFKDIVFTILAVSLIIIGTSLGFSSNHQKGKLMEQLKSMGFRAECPKCGKQIPKGNFVFCPFCGAQLQRK